MSTNDKIASKRIGWTFPCGVLILFLFSSPLSSLGVSTLVGWEDVGLYGGQANRVAIDLVTSTVMESCTPRLINSNGSGYAKINEGFKKVCQYPDVRTVEKKASLDYGSPSSRLTDPDISGLWTVNETCHGCGGMGEYNTYDIVVTKNGQNFTFQFPVGTTTGTLVGHTVYAESFSYPEDDGITRSYNIVMTISEDELSGSYTDEWEWCDLNGENCCGGTCSGTMTRISGGNSVPVVSNPSASPSSVPNDSPTLIFLAASVSDADGANDIVSVVIDLSSLGGTPSQAMYDDGTHGDATAGDGIYSIQTTASISASVGQKALTITASDQAGNTGSNFIT